MIINKHKVYNKDSDEFKSRRWKPITRAYEDNECEREFLKCAVNQLARTPSIEFIQVFDIDEDGLEGIVIYRDPYQRNPNQQSLEL